MLDLLVFGAHPDDCELFVGGLIYKLTSKGYQVGVVDITEGERSSRGTLAQRKKETKKASQILGLVLRVNLKLGDTIIANTEENRTKVIDVIRRLKPRYVLHQYPEDRHPDHEKAALLAKEASFYARLVNLKTKYPPHKPLLVFQYLGFAPLLIKPSFIVNISQEFKKKIEALKAYRSQFFTPGYKGTPTYISSEFFFQAIETRARYLGQLIGVEYGEAFVVEGPLKVDDPIGFFNAHP